MWTVGNKVEFSAQPHLLLPPGSRAKNWKRELKIFFCIHLKIVFAVHTIQVPSRQPFLQSPSKYEKKNRFTLQSRPGCTMCACLWVCACKAAQNRTGKVLCLLCYTRAHPPQSNVNPSAAPSLSHSLNQQSIYRTSAESACVCARACISTSPAFTHRHNYD